MNRFTLRSNHEKNIVSDHKKTLLTQCIIYFYSDKEAGYRYRESLINKVKFLQESKSEIDDDEELVHVARKRSHYRSIIFDSQEETDNREPPMNKNKVLKRTLVQRVQQSDSEVDGTDLR